MYIMQLSNSVDDAYVSVKLLAIQLKFEQNI